MTCAICNQKRAIKIKKNNFFLRTDSSFKALNDYVNLICINCGTIYHRPRISSKKLIKHYNSAYRITDSLIKLDNKEIDLPIKFEWTSVSYQRFYEFYNIIKKFKEIDFNRKDKIIDFGCYQGAFLYACKQFFKCQVIGTDYSINGLNLAKNFFQIKTYLTNKNFFQKKIKSKMITALHVFEHLSDPIEFLQKIKKNLLMKKGYIYLEIPNPFYNPLNDPTHLNLFSEDTIEYILKCSNYNVLYLGKSGIKSSNYLRNSRNLNIHVLAKSINLKKSYFPIINIGASVNKKLLNSWTKHNLSSLMIVLKNFLKNFSLTTYIFFIGFINIFSSKFAIFLHNFFKKISKNFN